MYIPYQDNITPLYVASQEGHHDAVQILLGAGAHVNTARSDVSNDFVSLWTDENRNYLYM